MIARVRNNISTIGAIFLVVALALQAHLDSYWEAKAPLVDLILFLFTVLFLSETLASRRHPGYLRLYLGIQALLVAVLLFTPPGFSVAASLYIVLILQAVPRMSAQDGYRLLGLFVAIIFAAFVVDEGWLEGLSLLFLYGAAYAFIFVLATGLRDLQAAHRQLQSYSDQAEEAAAAQERNRLARNLHDSVTQTIFSMTLTVEAASLLLEREPEKAAGQLNKLQELAEHALVEMRSLIFELRPAPLSEEGLVPTLSQHLERVEKEHGLSISLQVEGEEALSLEQSEHLLRIVQEGINNVVKHADAEDAGVHVRFGDRQTSLEISDSGRGFKPSALPEKNRHMGLDSMRERVEMMGGTLRIDSSPGLGSQISVQLPLRETGDQDG